VKRERKKKKKKRKEKRKIYIGKETRIKMQEKYACFRKNNKEVETFALKHRTRI